MKRFKGSDAAQAERPDAAGDPGLLNKEDFDISYYNDVTDHESSGHHSSTNEDDFGAAK